GGWPYTCFTSPRWRNRIRWKSRNGPAFKTSCRGRRETNLCCKFWDYPGEILLIILWMSYFLYPQLARLPAAAETVSQQKKGQNFSRVISKFTSRDSVIITPC